MNLRRYQRRLLFGGGLASTLIALMILGMGVRTGINAHVEAQRRAFALGHAMVMEHGHRALIDPARITGMQGIAMIVDENGEVTEWVGDCCDGGQAPTRETLRRVAAVGIEHQQDWHDEGLFILSQGLDDKHVLVFAYAGSSIAAAASEDVFVDVMLTLPTLGMMWLLLISLKLRVFRPLLEWSRRVYEGEKLSRTLIDTAPVGLGLISLDTGKALLCSPAMAEIAARIAPGEDALPDACIQLHQAHVARGDVSWRQGTFNEDLQFQTQDRIGLDLSVSMVRARYQGKNVLVTAFTDVTAKSRVEQQLRKARQASDRANAAKSAFLAAMSHEIRTPLNAILGNLELLSHSALDAPQRDRLRTIRSASDGLLAIVSDVLDFSKIEAGELRLESIEFDVLEVAAQALRMFTPTARGKGLILTGQLGDTVTLPMRGDPTRLGQIINNLLSNAVKFTEQGGVALSLTIDEAQASLVMTVEDTGIGMSAEQLSRLFRAFSQADPTINRRFGGTGLGLALCSRLAQAMGGALSVQSEAGRGSRFTLRLPLGDCEQARQMPRFAGERIALLAACASARAYVGRSLQAWGLCVETYAHPAALTPDGLGEFAAVVLWGERNAWQVDDENRLVEEAPWVIDCGEDGPTDPVAMGRVLSVSMVGLTGLASSLGHALHGTPLSAPDVRRPVLARRLNVLVAEDNPVNQRLFEEQLRVLGCEPTAVENGVQALACLEQAPFDVLLTDLAMPEMDGYALAQAARARWPAMPVVAASAHMTPLERVRCQQAGVALVLGKPLPLGELAQALSDVTGVRTRRLEVDKPRSFLGGRAMSEDLKRTFRLACESALAEIGQGRQAGNIPQLLAELHKLRGMLDVFGEPGLSRLTADAETCLKTGRGLDRAEGLLDALAAGLARASSP
ncbi:hybrid sensor histidine kinase/response regulator [Achromobacter kerstersii]|uniref:hybrid sensor histidine kinase/response regulator n=1 Tax=Achromobacter kerstersii TaxID=1353890 RepID=UPI0032078EC2